MFKKSALNCQRASGFSAIELMVSLTILAILMSVAIPSFQTAFKQNRLSVTVSDFFSALNLARAEAIRRGRNVNVAPQRASDFATGWIVFVDVNNDGIFNAGDETIFTHGATAKGLTILQSKTSIEFQASGKVDQGGSWIFSIDDNMQRKVILNLLGRPRICNPVKESSTC